MSLNRKRGFFYSVISDNPSTIFKNLSVLQDSCISGIHFDVMDGTFVPRLGLYPELLAEIKRETSLFIEVHAMISTPSFFIKKFADAGADRIIYHIETNDNVDNLISSTKQYGLQCGLALNPNSSTDMILPFISNIDAVMLMAINPGIPKHPFIPETYTKLQKVKDVLKEREFDKEIIIDGGVTFKNLENLFSYGANTLICGSGTLFSPERSLNENLEMLNSAI
jgi:ribulose-phosphate 3-epimerase